MMMSAMFFVGVDGGASKTAGVLCDSEGQVLARCRKGGCVISAQPSPDSLAALKGMVNELLAHCPGGPKADWHCGLGVSGIDFADQIPGQVQAIRQAMGGLGTDTDSADEIGLSPTRLTIVNDGIVALWGASSAGRAGIIQHGSGLTSAFRRELGGEQLYDCLDTSGLCDLRQEAVRVVSRMIDGRCPPSGLMDHLLRHWHVEHPEQFSEMVYRGMIPWQRLWSSVPTVFQCWLAGDAAADALVRKAAEDYARMAQAISDRIGPGAVMALGGGVLQQAPPRFWHLMEAELRRFASGTTLRKPALSPEEGAAVMACHHAGADARKLFAGLELQRSA
jgi:N-acetylglucosamine kinase-like BadF-type ATPase